MPINSPFFIKRYISNDLEQGALSRFYWYYPQDYQKVQFGGVGMFFEVTYSVSGDNYLEDHLVKLVWDFFVEAYYDDTVILTGLNRFKLAIKKSVQRLVSLIEESNIDEGIDVNILYSAVVADPHNPDQAKVYLARIGESDVFLLRDAEYLSLVDIIPANDLVQPIQAGVGELQKGDVILFGNKELIGASLDSQMIRSENWHALLDSLQEFQTNLFGSKKIIVLGFFDSKEQGEDGDGQNEDQVTSDGPEIVQDAQGAHTLQQRATTQLKAVGKKTQLWGRSAWQKIRGLQERLPDKFKGVGKSLTVLKRGSTTLQAVPQAPASAAPSAEIETVTTTEKPSEVHERVETKPSRDKSSHHYSMDSVDVESFRRRRSASGRAMSEVQGRLGSIVSSIVNKGKSFNDNNKPLYGVSKVVQSPFQGLRNRISTGKLIAIGLGILLGVFILWRIFAAVKANQIKSDYLGQINQFQETYAVVDSETDDTQSLACITAALNLTQSVEKEYGPIASMKDAGLKESASRIAGTWARCQLAYDQVNDIVRVGEASGAVDVITDFAVRIGEGSQVVDMTIQDTIVYVTDKGKAAVYSFNTTNNEILRLDDPSQLIKSPTQIVSGEKKEEIYLWDSTNGFLQYKTGKGFSQINVGTKDLIGGEVTALEYFGGNLYFSLAGGNTLYRLAGTPEGFEVAVEYFESLSFLQISDIMVDGSIFVTLREFEEQSLYKYFNRQQDKFSFISTTGYQLGALSAAHTSIYENKPIYVFDQQNKTVVLIDKPGPKNHPGQGVMLKRVLYGGTRANVWQNVTEISVSRDSSNVERGLYMLDGSLLWRVALDQVLTE